MSIRISSAVYSSLVSYDGKMKHISEWDRVIENMQFWCLNDPDETW